MATYECFGCDAPPAQKSGTCACGSRLIAMPELVAKAAPNVAPPQSVVDEHERRIKAGQKAFVAAIAADYRAHPDE